jgi:hypothetical protein
VLHAKQIGSNWLILCVSKKLVELSMTQVFSCGFYILCNFKLIKHVLINLQPILLKNMSR